MSSKARRHLSLRTRLMLLALVTTVLALFGLQVILAQKMQELSRRWLERRALGITTILAGVIAPGIEFDTASSVAEGLSGLAKAPDVLYAVVRRQDGTVLAGFRADLAPPPVTLGDIPGAQMTSDPYRLQVDMPVRAKGGARGSLTIAFSLAEMNAENRANRLLIVAACATVALAMIGMLLYLTGSIVSTLQRTTQIARRIAEGDLSQQALDTRGAQEIAEMASAFNQMIEGQRNLVRQIADISQHLAGAASELYAAAQDQEDSASKQAVGVEEVSQTIQGLLDSAANIADSAREVLGNAQRSKETADSTSSRIAELSRHTSRISEILEVIRDIADRSDLLALNASLEALRAGEAGRPFSLVAGEMRRLAERVTASVQDVKTLIADIRASGASTVMANEEGRKLTDSTTQSARHITVVTSQQRTGTEQVSQSMGHIAQLLSQTVLAAQQTRSSAGVLKEQADRLSDVVGRFHVVSEAN